MVLSVTVYQFEYFDHATNSLRVAQEFATEKMIRSIRATLLPHTAKEVPESEITFSGIWRPPD